MNIKEQVQQMDSLVTKGSIIEAVQTFFADTANTSDYNNLKTSNKREMLQKMEGFLGSIAAVNGITHHNTLVEDHTSSSEFTFDFDMKDGSKIYWHEFIKRLWNVDGKVVSEEYFLAHS